MMYVRNLFLKLLFRLVNDIWSSLRLVIPDNVWFVIKKFLPSSLSQNIIRNAYAKEWRAARKYDPLKFGLKRLRSGINIVGFFQVAKGISEAARNNLLALKKVKIAYSVVDYEMAMPSYLKTETLPPTQYSNEFIFNTNLIHINPPELPYLWGSFEKKDLVGRYTIGVWYWELPSFPDEWGFAFELVDEVWVASQFVFDCVSAKSPVPVKKIPPCIELTYNPVLTRSDFNLPSDSLLFLCSYDVMSVQARKNPQAAVEAFQRVFRSNDLSVGLVIKVNNAQKNPTEIKYLQNKLRGYSNCYIIDEIFDKLKMNTLINLIDVYISLHRSEGFGLIPAEAMYLGKPVVMTKWSGNVDFMSEKNSCGVNYSLISVGNNAWPYDPNQFWANPDINHAAEYLQRLYTDHEYYETISQEASKTIRNKFSPQKVGDTIYIRLLELGLI